MLEFSSCAFCNLRGVLRRIRIPMNMRCCVEALNRGDARSSAQSILRLTCAACREKSLFFEPKIYRETMENFFSSSFGSWWIAKILFVFFFSFPPGAMLDFFAHCPVRMIYYISDRFDARKAFAVIYQVSFCLSLSMLNIHHVQLRNSLLLLLLLRTQRIREGEENCVYERERGHLWAPASYIV